MSHLKETKLIFTLSSRNPANTGLIFSILKCQNAFWDLECFPSLAVSVLGRQIPQASSDGRTQVLGCRFQGHRSLAKQLPQGRLLISNEVSNDWTAVRINSENRESHRHENEHPFPAPTPSVISGGLPAPYLAGRQHRAFMLQAGRPSTGRSPLHLKRPAQPITGAASPLLPPPRSPLYPLVHSLTHFEFFFFLTGNTLLKTVRETDSLGLQQSTL